jgi:hypothetical protein
MARGVARQGKMLHFVEVCAGFGRFTGTETGQRLIYSALKLRRGVISDRMQVRLGFGQCATHRNAFALEAGGSESEQSFPGLTPTGRLASGASPGHLQG